MKVEKKITRRSYDYAARDEYYQEAQICPKCGHDSLFNSDFSIVGIFRERKLYTCKKCGCRWKVKLYHEKKAKREA